jgi:O-antigen/teichoic acid export membrane protein
VVIAAVFGVTRVGMVYGGAGVSAFIAASVLEELASHGVSYLLCRRYGLLGKPAGGEPVRVWPLLAEGLPLMLSFILIALYSRIDVVMIQALRGVQETGLYAASTRISEVWHMIPGIMVGTFLPHFAQIRKSDPERFLRTIRAFAAMFFWGSCAVILVTTIAAPYLVGLLFGADFAAAVPMVKIHVWSFTSVCLGGLLAYWYILEKLNHYLIIASVVGLTTNIVLNYFLIPRFGGSGAAAATAVSYTLSVLAPLSVSARTRRMGATVLRGICLRIN